VYLASRVGDDDKGGWLVSGQSKELHSVLKLLIEFGDRESDEKVVG
jgi:hypothetical protein